MTSRRAVIVAPMLAVLVAGLTVLVAPATGGAVRASSQGRAGAPVVTLLVAGKQKTILPAQRVRLRAGLIPVPGAGRCALGPGTALGALEAARRRGRLRYAVRRQSGCTSETLFVDRIDGRSNAGDGGWEYKVNGRSPAVGAAVPATRGGARIRSGSRVLWFYCVHANRCQGTLELRLLARAAPGSPLTAHVVARDDNGRASAVGGATVRVAGSLATTDASGATTLTAPAAPGRYLVTATAPGRVDAFPETLAVP